LGAVQNNPLLLRGTEEKVDRKAHWEKIYHEKKPTEVSWYQAEPARSLDWIRDTGAPRDARIIDIGGGASLLVDRLLDLGYRNVTVLDLSEAALSVARRRLGPLADQVRWINADITRCDADLSCDVWHDRAVFHFLTDSDDRKRYVDLLSRSVRAGGHVVLSSFAPDGPEKCSGLPVCRYDGPRIESELGPAFVLRREESELHRTPADKEQRFRYFLFQRT
jgi:SAM-dependent methyltransferase